VKVSVITGQFLKTSVYRNLRKTSTLNPMRGVLIQARTTGGQFWKKSADPTT
jgi:hypothetical protein